MILSTTKCALLFLALFISSYLLTLLVDFEPEGQAVCLKPFFAQLLFPCCHLNKYNVVAVCLQSINYVFTAVTFACSWLHVKMSDIIQAIVVLGFTVFSIVFIIVINKKTIKKNKTEDSKNDR